MTIRTRSLIIMFSQGLSQATSIILGVILVRMVSKEIYGTWQQVNLVYLTLAGAITLQLHNSLYYYIPKLGIEKRRTLITQTFIITLVISLIVSLIMFLGSGWIAKWFDNPKLFQLLKIFALYPFIERLQVLLPAFFISIDRPLRAGSYTVISTIARIGVVIILCASGFDLSVMLWGVIGSATLVVVVGTMDMIRFCPDGPWSLDRLLIRDQFHYAWPLLASTIVGVINLQMNNFLISAYYDTATYAVYSNGTYQIPIIALVTTSVTTAMMPDLVRNAENNRFDKALSIWQEGARKCALVIFPCFVLLMIVAQDLMTWLFTPEFVRASIPFRIFLLSLPMRIAIYATLFRAVGKTKPVAIAAAISLLVNAALGITLLYLGNGGRLSFAGPAIATVIANWCGWVYIMKKIESISSVPFSKLMRWKELGILFGVCVLSGILPALIPLDKISIPGIIPFSTQLDFWRIVIRTVIYGVTLFIAFWGLRLLHKDEKELITLPVSFLFKHKK